MKADAEKMLREMEAEAEAKVRLGLVGQAWRCALALVARRWARPLF